MNPASFFLTVLLVSVVSRAPHVGVRLPTAPDPAWRSDAPEAVRPATASLVAWAEQLRAANRRDGASTAPSAGNLWIETDRLRQTGHRVRHLEWAVSDLENSLRRGPADAAARRHLLNKLDYEIEALTRRSQ